MNPKDVAAILVSDFLTDQQNRPLSSIYPMDSASGVTPMLAQNNLSKLTDLDKISITKRTKLNILDFYKNFSGNYYSAYYLQLQASQRVLFRKSINTLITRAKSVNFAILRERYKKNGLSIGESQHLAILEKIFKFRLESLENSRRAILTMLEGEK